MNPKLSSNSMNTWMSLLAIAGILLLGASLWIPLLMAVVFAVLLSPLHRSFTQRWKIRTTLSALLLTLGLTFLFLTPASVLIFIAARGVSLQVQAWKNAPRLESNEGFYEGLLQNETIHGFLERLSRWFPVGIDEITQGAEDLIRTLGGKVGDFATSFLAGLPGTAMGTLVMILSVFFLIQEGERLGAWLKKFLPWEESRSNRFAQVLVSLCRSVILASVASGAAQALVFGVILAALGTPNAGGITLLVFLCSFLPLVGSAPITLGVALHSFFILQDRSAALVLILAAMGVGLLDNIVRPWVLKGAGNLHPLLAFVAAFGGIHVFGFSGVFLGPILAGLCVEVLTSEFSDPETGEREGEVHQVLPPGTDQIQRLEE